MSSFAQRLRGLCGPEGAAASRGCVPASATHGLGDTWGIRDAFPGSTPSHPDRSPVTPSAALWYRFECADSVGEVHEFHWVGRGSSMRWFYVAVAVLTIVMVLLGCEGEIAGC